ncbi:mRNA turnover protein 4 homolog [Homarus americanus]|uniref:Ribosome assembly factor mrt4 n=1 Tax=Homarus americanus TaxID=6706 RepID=A0A8J5JYL7_HOMAM|nr:mRNA turnover protein 4 homolog [Homarus americanus]KAG7164891.1 mRNA turnover protein 4-like [Homarus americanus]
MPKSKRDKKISLTRTKKKGLEFKQNLVEEIRSCIASYARIFVFSADHVKTNKLKDMRLEWGHSRFFLGKNKVMALALGRTPEEEIYDNLHKVSQKLVGQRGLLFTNSSEEEVLDYFENKRYPVHPHAGDLAGETVELKQGLLEQFSHSLEPHLRKLGLPTRLQRGIPELLRDHTVCVKGKPLTPAQASILKLLGKEMSFFHLGMQWCWRRLDGSFEKLLTRSDQSNTAREEASEEENAEMKSEDDSESEEENK